MEENQLQLGPVEFVGEDIDPNELPIDTDLPENQDIPLVTPMSDAQQEEARAMMYAVTADSKFYTDPLAFTPQYFGEHVREMVRQLQGEEAAVRRDALLQVLSDPDLDVTGRIEIGRSIYKESYDAAIARRSAMMNVAVSQAAQEPDDVATETLADAADAAEELPTSMSPAYTDGVDIGLTPYGWVTKIQQAYTQAEENTRFSDIAGSVIPFAYQTVTSEIASKLGMDMEKYGAWLAQGSVMREIGRELELRWREAENGTPEEREAFTNDVNAVLEVLKNNSGTFDDTNNAISTVILSEAFPYVLRGESALDAIEVPRQEAIAEEALARFNSAKANMEAYVKAGNNELAAQAKEEMEIARADRIAAVSAAGRDDRGMTFNEWLGNFSSIDDLLLVGGLATNIAQAALKAGRRTLPRNITTTNKAAPDIVVAAVQRGLTTDATVLGARVEKPELLQAVLPNVRPVEVDSSVNAALRLTEEERFALEQSKANVGYVRYSADEQAEAVSEITDSFLKNTDAAPAAINVANSNVRLFQTEGGDTAVRVAGVFGASPTAPFRSGAAAREAARKVFGSDANVRVLKYDPADGGKLVDAPEGAWGRGKFYFSVDTNIPYEAAVNVNQRLAFGEGAIRPGLVNRWWWKTLGKGRNMFNPLSQLGTVFDARWIDELHSSRDAAGAVRAGLLKALDDSVKRLSSDEYEAFNSILREGSKAARTYTVDELRTVAQAGGYQLTDNIQRSYYQFRRALDAQHEVMDTFARKRLLADGFKEVAGPLGRVGFAKPVAIPSGSITVFDPIKNTHVKMTPSELRAAEKNGQMLMQLDRPILRARSETSFVLAGGKVEVRALPARGVLPRVEGYIPRVYNAPYVVYGIKDGVEKALGTAATEADAAKLAARLKNVQQKSNGRRMQGYSNFTFRPDRRTATMGESGVLAEEILGNLGGLGFGQRTASRLINGSKDIGDNLMEPVEAAIRAADAVAYTVTKGDVIRQMEERAFAMAKTRMAGEEKVELIGLEDYVNHFRSKGWDKEADQIEAVLAQTAVMRGMPDSVGLTAEAIYRGLESVFARAKWNTGAAWAAEKAAERADPVGGKLMALSHFATVATNWTGQIALQMAQPMLLTGLSGPQNVLRGYRTALTAMLPLVWRHFASGGAIDPKAQRNLVRAVGKAAGMEADEAADFVAVIERTGIFDAVAMDTRMRIQARDRATELMLNRAQRKGAPKNGGFFRRQAAKLSRMAGTGKENVMLGVERAGFTTSEMFNQLVTFSTLYARDKATGVANLKNRRYVDSLVGRTREVTGSMVREASYGFQRGFGKLMFQFVSYPWKMTQLALPEALGGSRRFTQAEKNGILGAQFVMYGAAGVPFASYIINKINEYVAEHQGLLGDESGALVEAWNNPVVQTAFQGFLMDWSVNQIINLLSDEESNLDVAGRFAPMGGTQFAIEKFTEPFLNPDAKSFVDLLLGQPGFTASKVGAYVQTLHHVTLAQAQELDTIPFDQRLEQLGKEGLALFVAQYRRELALELAESMDGFAMGGGMISQERMTEVEKMAFRLFNIQTTDREDYWKLRREFRNSRYQQGDEERTVQAREYANDYFNQLLRNNAMWHDQLLPQEQIERLRDDWVGNQSLLFSVAFNDDPEMLKLINEQVSGKILEVMNNQGRTLAEQRLVDDLTSKLKSGIDNPASLINRLMNSDALTDAQKAQVEQVRVHLFEEEEN